jgi:hypothetical protein
MTSSMSNLTKAYLNEVYALTNKLTVLDEEFNRHGILDIANRMFSRDDANGLSHLVAALKLKTGAL